ncbi:hypothetical protein HYC85_021200, partial [Camellia sinensis]
RRLGDASGPISNHLEKIDDRALDSTPEFCIDAGSVGAYDDEEVVAHAYDLAALKYWGLETILNFSLPTYQKQLIEMEGISREEFIGSLRRKGSGFSRGVSKYRGVARHHHNGRWEARIGRVFDNKYLYLGTYGNSCYYHLMSISRHHCYVCILSLSLSFRT